MNKAPMSVKDALQKFKIPFAARVHKMLFFLGFSSQHDKAVEEFAELVQAMMKRRNSQATDDQVREEITDAGIMLDMLRMMYNLTASEEREIRDQKLRRSEVAYYKQVTIEKADLSMRPESDYPDKDVFFSSGTQIEKRTNPLPYLPTKK